VPAADERLLEAISAALGPGPARLLDLPAGDGGLTAALRARGHDVTPADLLPTCCVHAADCVRADMNERLPFGDDAFDAIASQEGVEHLENLAGFLRECARVGRDGAHLWITTPNFLDLSSRLAFLLSGQKSWRAGLPNERSTLWGREGGKAYHGHAFTLPWFQLRYLLRLAGFDDFRLEARGWSRTSCLLWPLLRWPVGWFLWRGLAARERRDRRKGKAHTTEALRRALHAEGVSRPVLCGKGLIVHARLRRGGGDGALG
jgi:SAM-dependent methyltransferase